MNDNLVLVTSPDYYHGNDINIFLYDMNTIDSKVIMELLLQSEIPLTVSLGSADSDLEWTINQAKNSDITIVNLNEETLVKGFILRYNRVYYYNNNSDLKTINTNYLEDPIEKIIGLINEYNIKKIM